MTPPIIQSNLLINGYPSTLVRFQGSYFSQALWIYLSFWTHSDPTEPSSGPDQKALSDQRKHSASERPRRPAPASRIKSHPARVLFGPDQKEHYIADKKTLGLRAAERPAARLHRRPPSSWDASCSGIPARVRAAGRPGRLQRGIQN